MAIGNSANSDRRHRIKATAVPIFYVSSSGSDSNDGLTSGTAFATIQNAIDVLSTIDCNGFDPIIYLVAGSHIAYAPIYTKNVVGVGLAVSLVGLGVTSGATKILSGNQDGNTGYQNSVIVNYARTVYFFQNLEITHQWDDVQYPTFPKYIVNLGGKLLFDNVRIRGNGASHDCFVGYSGGSWDYLNTLEIQGTFRWIFDIGGASVNLRETTIASISNPTCAIFAKAYSTYIAAYNITLTGTLTGKRFELAGSTIDTIGFALNFPGTVDGTYDSAAVGATPLSHLSATDPHPQYLTQAEGDALYLGGGVTAGDKGDIIVSAGGVWSIDDGVIDNANIAANAGIDWSKISKTGATAGDVGALSQTAGDARYRQLSANIPANEITGTFADNQIPSSIARDTEVAAAVTAHETTFNHSSFATTTQLNNLRNEVGMIGTAFTNTSAANAAAVITVAAPGAGQCLQLNQLTFSYSGAPTNGLLTIQQASTVIHETAITASGAGPTIAGYKLAVNTAMTITLAAGGSGVIGRVSASVSTVPA